MSQFTNIVGSELTMAEPQWKQNIAAIEAAGLSAYDGQPQPELPLKHRHAPGIYCREIEMPAGALIVGHEHLTEHFNVVISGSALVAMNGSVETIRAPDVFVSQPGVRKVLLIQETMRWLTFHANPSNEQDQEKLDAGIIRKSDAYLEYEAELKLLREHQQNA